MTLTRAIQEAACEVCKKKAHELLENGNARKTGYYVDLVKGHIYYKSMMQLCKSIQ